MTSSLIHKPSDKHRMFMYDGYIAGLIERISHRYRIKVYHIMMPYLQSHVAPKKFKKGWRITFGWEGLKIMADKGYEEYPNLQYLMPKDKPTLMFAAKYLVLHEMAHVICMDNGYMHTHHVHFKEVYAKLIKEYVS